MATFGQKRGANKVTGSKSESAQVLRTTKPSDKLNPKTVDPVRKRLCHICFGFTHVFGGVGLNLIEIKVGLCCSFFWIVHSLLPLCFL